MYRPDGAGEDPAVTPRPASVVRADGDPYPTPTPTPTPTPPQKPKPIDG